MIKFIILQLSPTSSPLPHVFCVLWVTTTRRTTTIRPHSIQFFHGYPCARCLVCCKKGSMVTPAALVLFLDIGREFRYVLIKLPNSPGLNQTTDCKLPLTCINTAVRGAPWQYSTKRRNILQVFVLPRTKMIQCPCIVQIFQPAL